MSQGNLKSSLCPWNSSKFKGIVEIIKEFNYLIKTLTYLTFKLDSHVCRKLRSHINVQDLRRKQDK